MQCFSHANGQPAPVFAPEQAPVFAPKGRQIVAQGAALGLKGEFSKSRKGDSKVASVWLWVSLLPVLGSSPLLVFVDNLIPRRSIPANHDGSCASAHNNRTDAE